MNYNTFIRSVNALLILLHAIFMVSSCTIEKRQHMSGYHIDWKNEAAMHGKSGFHTSESQEKLVGYYQIQSDNSELTINPTKTELTVTNNSDPAILKADVSPIDTKSVYTAASGNEVVLFNKANVVKVSNEIGIVQNSQKNFYTSKEISTDKAKLKGEIKSDKHAIAESEDGNIALRIIGWIFLSLGILVLLFASILGGIVVMGLGLALILVGKKKSGTSGASSSSGKKESGEYLDVLYLKNGSIIRGMIIEQIPNVQIKIQSRDGNVFVYKMDEVEKITKELSK